MQQAFDPTRPYSVQSTGFDPARPFTIAPSLDRSLGQRTRENIIDGGWRSGLGAIRRSADPQADGLFNLKDLTRVRPGSPLDWILDRTAGPDREWGAADVTVPTLGAVVTGQGLRGTPAASNEDARRSRYDARAAADPITNPGDALSYFGGQVIGGAPSPENWMGGGAAGAGRTVLGRSLARMGEQAAIGAGADAALQVGDMGAGIEDRYSLSQTLLAAGVGATVQGGIDLAPRVPGVRQAGAAAGRGFDYAKWAAGNAGSELRAQFANPLPSFGGAAMDTGAAPRASGAVPSPLGDFGQPRAPTAPPAPRFAAPVSGPVSSGFGPRVRPNRRASANHPGIDYAVPEGTSVAAAADGEVIFAGPRGNYGNRVVIRHADGSESSYSHLSAVDARVGDRVAAGQTVARSGSTGNVTGPHLHFEIKRGGRYVDPRAILNGDAPAAIAAAQASRAPAPTAPLSGEASPYIAATLTARPLDDAALGIGQRPAERSGLPQTPEVMRSAALDRALAAVDQQALASAAPGRRGQAREVPAGHPAEPVAVFDPAKPFTRTDGVTPPRLAARTGFNPERPFTRPDDPTATPQRLAIDMSGYAGRIGQTAPTVQSSGQAVGGLRAAPRPDAVGRGQGQAFAGKTVSDLAADLRQALGLTHRQGRVGARGALGTYDTGSGVVRTKAVDELDVLAHEATHALEYERKGPALDAALKAHGKHLETLAYPGAAQGVKREEGFAEFGRWYLTNPDHARRIAPDFFDAFERALEADAPEVLAGMRAVQSGYQNLLGSASIDIAKGSIAYTGSKGPIGDLISEVRRTGPGSTLRRVVDDLYTAVVDDLHPVSVAVRKLGQIYADNTGQKLSLKRAADPYALARLSREGYAAGHSDLMNGVTPYRGLDAEGASLADALETAGIDRTASGKLKNDALREFDVYLIARRMLHEWDRYSSGDLPNPPDRNTRAFHEQVIKDAEAAHPTWAKAADQTYEYLNNLWKKEFDAGLITQESYQHGMTAHPDYVPLMRDMSDKGPGGKGGKPRGALQFAGGVKAFEGSSRDIISPLSSIMRRTYELNAIIKRNDVMLALDDLAQAAGRGAGAIVERLPAQEAEAFTVNASDALQKTADELGLSGRDLTTMQKFADDALANDATITLFKQTEFSPRKGEAVVFVWRGGKKTPLLLPDGEFGQQMFQALAGMNRDLTNVVVEGMAAGTQLLRYGVTLSPEFMAANIVRDSLATWINTDVGFVPGLDTIRGGGMELAQGQTAQRYATAGGMRGGANTAATKKPFPKTDAEAEEQLQHLRRKGWKVKRFASWRGLAEATDLSETSTRIGVFAKGFEQAKARGLSDYEALIESGFTSRDYLDFARRGSRMLTASRLVTFLNAALQGLDKTGRVLTAGGNLKALLTPLSKEARTPAEKAALGHAYKAWAKITALGAFGLGLRMLYQDDPEYQEINDRLRGTHWVARIGGQWTFIPKPFELATLSNILERGFEATVLNDPTAGERLLSDFRHTIAPPSEIPALAVPFNIASNRDYLGRPIVPDHLRGTVDPELQFNSFTSDLGRLIGKTFKVAPAVVDYVVTGFGGSLGRYVLQGSNLVGETVTGRPRTAAGPEDMFLSRRFIRSVSRGSESQAEFWDQVSRDGGDLTQAEGSFRALVRDGRDEEAETYLNRLSPEARAYVLIKALGPEGGSNLHPLVRAQKAVSVFSDFRADVREGTLRDSTGAVVALTPEDRRVIDSAMADMAQAEMRNALIEAGVRGWVQKDRMDPLAHASRIAQTSPDAFTQLRTRLYLEKAPTDLAPEQVGPLRAAWAQLRPALSERRAPGSLVPMIRQRRYENGDTVSRYLETQRVMGGAYRPQSAPAQSEEPRGLLSQPQRRGLLSQ